MEFLRGAGLEMAVVWALSAMGIYFLVDRLVRAFQPRAWRRYSARTDEAPRTDSAEQLRWVMAAGFAAKRVMNLSEYKVFKEVEAELRTLGGGYRVFSQTALGEVLRSEDKRAHSAINAKRVDVLVVAPNGLPVLAVEYQGSGHYQGDAAARDAVKREALRKAGVAYVEAFESDGPDDIRRKVRAVLTRTAAA